MLALAFAACAPDPPASPAPPEDSLACPAGAHADAGACVPDACGTGPFGDAKGDVFVDATAAPGGDGSPERPFTSLDDAEPGLVVALAAGAWTANRAWAAGEPGGLVGRCAALVSLAAVDEEAPTLSFTGGRGDAWVLEDLTLLGPAPAIVVGGGALRVERVEVEGVVGDAVVATGRTAEVELLDSTVRGTRGARGAAVSGLALVAQGGAYLSATGVALDDNQLAAVAAFDDGTSILLADTAITGVQPGRSDDRGFGVAVEAGAHLEATGLTVTGAVGYGMEVNGAGASATLADVTIADVAPLPDGVSVGLILDGGSTVGALDLVVTGARAGLVAVGEGTAATVDGFVGSGLSVTPAGDLGYAIQAIGGASVSTRLGAFDAVEGPALVAGSAGRLDLEDVALDGAAVPGRAGILAVDATVVATSLSVDGARDVGIGVAGPTGTVTLTDTVVRGVQTGGSGDEGLGVAAQDGGTLTAEGLVVEDVETVGLYARGPGSRLDVGEAEVRRVEGGAEATAGRGVEIADGATFGGRSLLVVEAREVGVFATGGAVTLSDTNVSAVRAGTDLRAAYGVVAQSGGAVDATDLRVEAVPGPGLVAAEAGTIGCVDCEMVGNGFAGAVVFGGTLTLTGCELVDQAGDASQGGGVGVFLDGGAARLDGTRVTGNRLAGVWVERAGDYAVVGADLAGGPGVTDPAVAHGNAVFARAPVTVEGSTLRDSATAVLLNGTTATLADVTWSGNVVDLRQQACDGVEPVDPAAAPVTELCPPDAELILPLTFGFYLAETPVSGF